MSVTCGKLYEKGITALLQKTKKAFRINGTVNASLWYIGSNLLSRGTAFIFTPIFTRLLTPSEYGLYPLYTSLMSVFTVITSLQLSGSTAYRAFAKFKSTDGFLSAALVMQSALTAAAVSVYAIFTNRVNGLTSLGSVATLLLIIQIFFNSAEGLYFAKKRYEGDYKTVSFLNAANGICPPILALLLIRMGFRGNARILAQLSVSAIIFIPIVIVMLKRGGIRPSAKHIKFIFSYTVPLIPHYLATALTAQSDKIIIAHTLGKNAVGEYSAAYSAGLMLSFVSNGILLALTPYTVRKMLDRDGRVADAVTATLKVLCGLTLAFLSFAPEIFALFVSEKYYSAIGVIYPTAISVIFSFLASLFSSCVLHSGKPLTLTKNSAVTAAVNILTSYALITRIGYVGGAVATLISYLVLFLLNLHTARKAAECALIHSKEACFSFGVLSVFAPLLFVLRFSLTARILLLFACILLFTPSAIRYKKTVIGRII